MRFSHLKLVCCGQTFTRRAAPRARCTNRFFDIRTQDQHLGMPSPATPPCRQHRCTNSLAQHRGTRGVSTFPEFPPASFAVIIRVWHDDQKLMSVLRLRMRSNVCDDDERERERESARARERERARERSDTHTHTHKHTHTHVCTFIYIYKHGGRAGKWQGRQRALQSIVFETRRPGAYDMLVEAVARQTNRNYQVMCHLRDAINGHTTAARL
jgi:hypothetical protein